MVQRLLVWGLAAAVGIAACSPTGSVGDDDKGDLKDGGITVYKVTGGKWAPLESVGGK